VIRFIRQIAAGFFLWIDAVAATIVAMRGLAIGTRTVELFEETDGVFKMRALKGDPVSQNEADRLRIADGKIVGAVPAGWASKLHRARIEIAMLPSRFVFRPLELPRRATEFLEGIVRAQIDRLTPWSSNDAAFGWSQPTQLANDRIVTTVAATPRGPVASLAGAVAGLGVDSVVVCTSPQGAEPGSGAIKVFEQGARSALEVGRIRRTILAILLVGALVAGAAGVAAVLIGGDLEDRRSDVLRHIAARRASILAGDANDKVAALAQRKHEIPSSMIVLDVLSQILPDHTYVTELRIVGDKMQIVGVTRDAPSWIQLIDQSKHFTRATFFAPTTRGPSDPGERFHIEAHIEPVYTPNT